MKTKVYIIESEKEWGRKIDEVKTFPTQSKAKAFVKRYNAKYNSSTTVPDWYMAATLEPI